MREIQQKPEFIVKTAMGRRQMSPHRLTVFVEGVSDMIFLTNIVDGTKKLYFQDLYGRQNVLDVVSQCEREHSPGQRQFAVALVDLDDDSLRDQKDLDHQWRVYVDAYDTDGPSRDLETMIIRSKVLDRILRNFDIPEHEFRSIRSKLAKACSVLGAAYVTKNLLPLEEQRLIGSFDGIEFPKFFDDKKLLVYESECFEECFKSVKSDQRRSELRMMFNNCLLGIGDNPWSFTRGHDLIEMLSRYLRRRTSKKVAFDFEVLVRNCHYPEFLTSNLYNKLLSIASD